MRRLAVWMVCAALLSPAAAFAGGTAGFHDVVSSIETQYHVHATHVPMMGFVNFVAFTSSVGGVRGMQVAEFEHFSADGDALQRLVAEKLGEGWEPVVHELDRKTNGQTYVFMRPEKKRLRMLVLDLDNGELDVVQMSVRGNHWQGHWHVQ